MKEIIKNLPIVGKVIVKIYESFFKIKHFIVFTLLRKKISTFRWNKIRRELFSRFKNVENEEVQSLLNNIKKQGFVRVFNYPFVEKYDINCIQVKKDVGCEYYYVLHRMQDGEVHKIYFPKEWNEDVIRKAYHELLIEQDKDSPHCYENKNFPIEEGTIILDFGVAEGNFSINHIKQAKHIYLFEGDSIWYDPLSLTFEKWKEKITIIPKFVADFCDNNYISLQSFLQDITFENEKIIFKMDIEGFEERTLSAGREAITRLATLHNDITLIICTYHSQDSEANIRDILKTFSTNDIEVSRGYMILNNFCEKPVWPYIRRGLVFAKVKEGRYFDGK